MQTAQTSMRAHSTTKSMCAILTSTFACKLLTHFVALKVFDIRKNTEVFSLKGHTDTPTSLVVSPNGNFLLSPSFSSQVIVHDIRPFSPSPSRIHRTLVGCPAGFEQTLLRAAWSRDDGGGRVAVGGADRTVTIWEVDSGRILYKVRAVLHKNSFLLPIQLTMFPSVVARSQGHRYSG